MKLYQGDGPNSYRVRIFMAEKGIDVPMVRIDFQKAEHRSPEFLKLNSLGQIPVLELDDGTVITESIAICRYFENLYPDPPLFGRDPIGRAKVEMWNRRMEQQIFATIGNVPLHSDPFFSQRHIQVPAFAEAQRAELPGKWQWLDRELDDGRPFIAGAFFSTADIIGMVASWLGDVFGMPIPDGVDNVRRWDKAMRARPSWNA